MSLFTSLAYLEQDVGIKPTSSAWKAEAQSLYQTCIKLVTGENFEISTFGFQNRHSASELPRDCLAPPLGFEPSASPLTAEFPHQEGPDGIKSLSPVLHPGLADDDCLWSTLPLNFFCSSATGHETINLEFPTGFAPV